MRYYLRIYKAFVIQNFRVLLLSKQNVTLGIITFFSMQIFNLLTIDIIFKNVTNIGGYDRTQILFIYGIFLLPRGLDHMISDYLWLFAGGGVKRGVYDKYMTKPLPTLFQVIIEKFDFNALAELILAFLLMIRYGGRYFTDFGNFMVFIALIINGVFIYLAIKIVCAAVAFYTKSSFYLLHSVYQTSNFSKYPVSIYPKSIVYIMYFILPFGLTTYLPYLAITGNLQFNFMSILSFFSGIFFLTLATVFWSVAEKNYESTGS